MNPHSRPQSPTYSEVPITEDLAQGEITKHSVASHYTISRDKTSLGSAGKDKLRALRNVGDDEQGRPTLGRPASPGYSLSSSTFSSNSIITTGDINDSQLHTPITALDSQHDTTQGQHGSLILSLQDTVKALRSENERLRRRQMRENKLDANFEVFHHILSKTGKETYLEKPYWAKTSEGIRLKANSPILYPDAYMQYKSLGFIVERYYSGNIETATEITEALRQNQIPDPIRSRECIRPVSKGMKEAIKLLNSEGPRKIPGIAIGEEMAAPYYWWYYYRSQPDIFDILSQRQAKLIRNLTDWIDANYSELYDQINSQFKRGMVSAVSMSFLIWPGDVLVHVDQDSVEAHQAISSLHVISKTTLHVGTSDDDLCDVDEIGGLSAAISPTKKLQQEWGVSVWSYRYNGNFYKETKKLRIKLSEDTENIEVPIRNLSVFPLRFASHELRGSLEQRGITFWSCRYRKYISYAKETKDEHNAGQRYMIDYSTYKELHPQSVNKWASMPGSKVEPSFIEQETPSEPIIYLLPRTVLGFNLRRKIWEELNVDQIKEVSWNKNAFSHLVADPETKELVQALVTNKVAAEKGTDLMQNKGNGLIMLLHGGPGTGKTFTAESVAEMAEKPLYSVTCGDIGTKPEDVEKYLESVFYLGKIWGCVVLLDEAEVFLEQRSLNDLARNALVSVFLRALEYYDGILILTSNRVGTFDEAFKSRIQLALHYKSLTQPQRARIWRNFFSHLKTLEEDSIDYDEIDSYIDELSGHEMNGRQIRNIITTARQWAQFRGSKMKAIHLMDTIKVTGKFDTYIKDVKEGYSDDQIARGDGVR